MAAKVVKRVRNKASYSSLPVHLCAPKFIIRELHVVCEALMVREVGSTDVQTQDGGLGSS
jgi:hypothetical protein